MSEPAVLFQNVSVRYRVPRERVSGIKEYAVRRLKRRIEFSDFWALQDVSFEVQPGEIFGIIGRNGAGKSTLLKVMSRVLQPTQGRLVLRGRPAPLLELGGGFHPELTGRENIFLNMALLGHARQVTNQYFDAIVEFSEIPEFIDAPLRTYSTGMVARLGFAVATCLRPEILLVDEVLSVGDSQFQQKCLDRMVSFNKQGTTIVIVSHGMAAIQAFCQRALWIDKGRVQAVGLVDDVIQQYIYQNRPQPTHHVAAAEHQIRSQPLLLSAPPLEKDHYRLDQVGAIYPADKIFNVNEGTISTWISFQEEHIAQDAILFHSDDSRFVLYLAPHQPPGAEKELHLLIARAGGNRRSFDTYFGANLFPEVSAMLKVNVDGSQVDSTSNPIPPTVKSGTASFTFKPDQWHQITMTWLGYPDGQLELFVDGQSVGTRSYDSRNDSGDNLPSQISIGMRPSTWTGELLLQDDGTVLESRPASQMSIQDAKIEISDLRLYPKALDPHQINHLYHETHP